jgi:molybdopterin converting factor subunit 1
MNASEGAVVNIKVLFFASAREAAGTSNIELSLDADKANTAVLRTVLAVMYPKLAGTVLDDDSITLAVNEEYVAAGETVTLQSGYTVALIPPISGG